MVEYPIRSFELCCVWRLDRDIVFLSLPPDLPKPFNRMIRYHTWSCQSPAFLKLIYCLHPYFGQEILKHHKRRFSLLWLSLSKSITLSILIQVFVNCQFVSIVTWPFVLLIFLAFPLLFSVKKNSWCSVWQASTSWTWERLLIKLVESTSSPINFLWYFKDKILINYRVYIWDSWVMRPVVHVAYVCIPKSLH